MTKQRWQFVTSLGEVTINMKDNESLCRVSTEDFGHHVLVEYNDAKAQAFVPECLKILSQLCMEHWQVSPDKLEYKKLVK